MTIEQMLSELDHDRAIARDDARRALALGDWERLVCVAQDLLCIEARVEMLADVVDCGLIPVVSSRLDKPEPPVRLGAEQPTPSQT